MAHLFYEMAHLMFVLGCDLLSMIMDSALDKRLALGLLYMVGDGAMARVYLARWRTCSHGNWI